MNNQYGTAGVDDYRAKDAAAKRLAMTSAVGAANNISAGQGLDQGNALQPREETPAERLLRELEFIYDVMRDTVLQQEAFATRLFGPRPEETGKGGAAVAGSGAMNQLAERVQWVREMALRLRDNQYALGQVA